MLNYIWYGFFLIGLIAALFDITIVTDTATIDVLVKSIFESSKKAVEIALGLIGTLCFWLGLLKIAEEAGLITNMARAITPFFHRLMPEIPNNHPAFGAITMNMAAGILGLDNATIPLGIKAMEEMHKVNPNKTTASNAQILFLVINASSVTLLPISIIMYRTQFGSLYPTMVMIPIIIATSISTLSGIFLVMLIQKRNIIDAVLLRYFAAIISFLLLFIALFHNISPEIQKIYSARVANLIIFVVIFIFLSYGIAKKVPIYETFVEGAREGFDVAIKIIPYLVAMLVAVGIFRSSGALEASISFIEQFCIAVNVDTEFVKALPTAFMKPFSGSAARAMMLESFNTYGVDAFPSLVASIIQGSCETTFYMIAVYYGAVGIKNTRYTIPCGLFVDCVGIVSSILVGYWFFT